jgi:hypothetical protein
MSRSYEMTVEIEKYDPERQQEIQDAAHEEWNFSDCWNAYNGQLSASGYSSLGGGETEEEFANRLAAAVWRANGGPCEVRVTATCMEDLPYESYSFSKDSPPAKHPEDAGDDTAPKG